MPKKYGDSVRKFVLNLIYVKKQPIHLIIEFTGISKRTLIRWADKRFTYKTSYRKNENCICTKAIPILCNVLDKTEGIMTYESMRLTLLDHGIKCCRRTIYNILNTGNITRKRVKRKRKSKNATPERLAEFKEQWNTIINDGEDVIFQDESHFSNNVLPLYGYSKKGQPVYIYEATDRTAYTLNLAFSKFGKIFWKIYKGSICTSRMQWFVDALPPVRLVMDNHSVHKAVKMTVNKVFTPVAQPQANPVEIVFSKVKQLFRNINKELPDLNVEDKIEMAVASLTSMDLENAIGHVHRFINTNY